MECYLKSCDNNDQNSIDISFLFFESFVQYVFVKNVGMHFRPDGDRKKVSK